MSLRKIVEISSFGSGEGAGVFARCSDDTVWIASGRSQWRRLGTIPQNDDDRPDSDRLCRDCGHFARMQGTGEGPRCNRPIDRAVNLIDGTKESSGILYAKTERASPGGCGPGGRHWSPRAGAAR